jgi:hypothetical protein
MYKNPKYFSGHHVDIINIENTIVTRNSKLGNRNLLGEIRHISPVMYDRLLLIDSGKNY